MMATAARLAATLQRLNLARRHAAWRYERLTRGVPRPSFSQAELQAQGYFSQCGQDKWVMETAFPGLRGGVFVDIGAHDGISFSNTYVLERSMGWTGLAIEPMPDVCDRLERNRRCLKVRGCIGGFNGTAAFLRISGYSEMLSGLVDQYDPRHLERIRHEVSAHGGTLEEIQVPCFRLDALLAEHGLRAVDYLSLDVEGAEYEILKNIDFAKIDVRLWGIENNYRDPRIPKLMGENGYDLVAIVGDELYLKRGVLG
jgi:FkbM family methyltransferase